MENRRDSAAIRLLLEALESSGALTRPRRQNYGLGVPPPRTYFDGIPDGFGFMPEPKNPSSFIGFFPLLRKMILYFFVGVMLLISSLCLYAAFYKLVMPGLHASEKLYFDYDGIPLRQQSTTPTRKAPLDADVEIPVATDFYCFNPDCDASSKRNEKSESPNHIDDNPPSISQQHPPHHQQGSPHAIADLFSRQNQWEAHHPDIVPHPKAENRILPRRTPHYIEVLLDLPESEKNRNIGMFGVLAHLQSSNGTMLATSMRTARFPHESRWISVIRKAICIIPLMLGALQESRRVLVPSFRHFVESEALPLRYVTVNLIMPPEKAEQKEVLEVLHGQLHIGMELTDFQQLLKDWFFTCLVIGTSVFYGLQVMLLLGLQWYWEYKREQRQNEQADWEDDASDNLEFDEMTGSGDGDNAGADGDGGDTPAQGGNDRSPVEVPVDEDDIDDGNDDPGFFECDGDFDDGHEGEWEDLPQNTANAESRSSNAVETIPDDEM